MKNKQKKVIITIVLSVFLSTSFIYFIPQNTHSGVLHFFTLKATASTYEMLEYLNSIKYNLNSIGINLEIFLIDYFDMWTPIHSGEFDLACIEISSMGDLNRYINNFYNENGSWNVFGYEPYMDYSSPLGTGRNEWYLNQINSYFPPESQERYELCWEWQTYMMDKLLPCLPLFNENEYLLIYNNLVGMNYFDGLKKSWGNLQWNGLHPGQVFSNEIVVADNAWIDLNPVIKNNSAADTFIENLIFDSLVQKDSDHTYWPHLAENWIYHDSNHVSFSIREDVKWQLDPDGLFFDEYLDIKDVYFSLYLYDLLQGLTWINDFSIIDDHTIDLELNLDILDYRNETGNYLDELNRIKIIPEFYLNQTQLVDGITPDVSHSSWQKFSENPFGTGLMEFTYFTEDVETLFSIFDDSWWLDNDTFNDNLLTWEDRYGNFQNSPDQLRIRILNDLERVLEFHHGRIDILPRTYDKLLDFEYNHYSTSDMELLSKPSNNYMALAFNMRETRAHIGNLNPAPLHTDYSVGLFIRKAIAYAIDREEINNVFYGGRMETNNWPISPSLGKWCNQEIGNYGYNMDWAYACMVSAGYDGCCGCIEIPEGFPDWKYGGIPSSQTINVKVNYIVIILSTISLLFLFKKKKVKKLGN